MRSIVINLIITSSMLMFINFNSCENRTAHKSFTRDSIQSVELNLMGADYLRKEKFDTALFLFSASIAMDSSSFYPRFNRANVYLAKKDFTNAIIAFSEIEDDESWDYNSMVSAFNIGYSLFELKCYPEAILVFDLAEKRADKLGSNELVGIYRADILSYRSRIKLYYGEVDDALLLSIESIRLDSIDACHYNLIGHIYKVKQEHDSACHYFSKAYNKGCESSLDSLNKYCQNTNYSQSTPTK